MAQTNRPRGREKNVTGKSSGVYKRGDGLGTGPVGSSGGYSNRPGTSNRPDNNFSGNTQHDFNTQNIQNIQAQSGVPAGNSAPSRGLGKSPLLIIIVIAAILLFGGKLGLGNLFGPGNISDPGISDNPTGPSIDPNNISSLLSGFTGTLTGGSTSTGWTQGSNTSSLNRNVSALARDKYTTIKGNGRDVVTIMVYMCGTDLESKSGMATSDLMEMASANISSNVNIIVYTGGCARWNNQIISSQYNQIYKVENGGLRCLEKNAGSSAMTKPETLLSFLQWTSKNYPANRNVLIFWDHGGGSISGYGYDEKSKNSGSMTLAGINTALKISGYKFDFIGFDACLMATAENALMLTDYADYLVASEETEPGVGWYYTNWITKLSANTSMATIDIGKNIVDDFVDVCAKQCQGQKTTLSVVDLAELEATAPSAFKSFALETSDMITSGDYKTISNARAGSREFASSSKIDQVDLIDLAYNTGTTEGKTLADTLKNAIKYNRTSSNMTNAYGLSIYFPYSNTRIVNNAISTYDEIGLGSEYSKCIQQFASMGVAGQATSLSNSSSSVTALPSLLGAFMGNTSSSQSSSGSSLLSSDMISGILGSLVGGNTSSGSSSLLSGLGSSLLSGATSSFFGKSLSIDEMTEYVSENQFDSTYLIWQNYKNQKVIAMPEDNWNLVQNIELNVFYDDGEGFIDLGLDNVFDFTDEGYLIGEYDGTWLAINDQAVPYYYMDTYDDGENYTITGRVPALINSERKDIILTFDNEHPYGYISGTLTNYVDGETDTVAKLDVAPAVGDTIDFVCDYYSYSGEYIDSYIMGDSMTVTDNMVISNVEIDTSNTSAVYRFTDIYNQNYWSEVID